MSTGTPPPRRDDDLLLSASGGGATPPPPAPSVPESGILPSLDGPPPPASGSGLKLPKILGDRYQLVGELGQGSFGSVLRAVDQETGREVALKIARDAAQAIHLERFRREGQITARLDHPGVVKIFDAGEYAGHPWLAYELIAGARTLEDVLQEGYLPERVERIRDAAAALGAAHAAGILHRDVKPANILVDEQGRIRVADFGLALAGDLDRLTRTGTFVGTPAYMAPEQIRGDKGLGPTIDVWALGVMLYEAMTGVYPFEGAETLAQLVTAINALDFVPPRERDPTIPRALEAVCLRALQADPAGRHPDGQALAADLEQALSGGGEPAAAGARIGAIAAGLLAVVVPGALLLRGSSNPEPPPRSSATDPAADSAPTPAPELPTLTLAGPRPDAATTKDEMLLRGRVEGTGTVEVRLGDRLVERVRAPGAFSRTVPVELGRNRWTLTAVDDAGRRSKPITRSVWRLPEWFDRLRGRDRPPLPLPGRLTVGEAEGIYLNPTDGSELVWVRKRRRGAARVGGEEADFFLVRDSRFPVGFTRGYFIGKYEVTWKQYLAFTAATGHLPHDSPFKVPETHPVQSVTWYEAVKYATWAGLRLPTEAEWFYAAVGMEKRKFPWGDQPEQHIRANLKGTGDGYKRTAPVGSFPTGAARCGALDMVGNVYEWVQDWYQDFNELPPERVLIDPRGPPTGTKKVTRGGGYYTDPTIARASRRTTQAPNRRGTSTGFRLAIGYPSSASRSRQARRSRSGR